LIAQKDVTTENNEPVSSSLQSVLSLGGCDQSPANSVNSDITEESIDDDCSRKGGSSGVTPRERQYFRAIPTRDTISTAYQPAVTTQHFKLYQKIIVGKDENSIGAYHGITIMNSNDLDVAHLSVKSGEFYGNCLIMFIAQFIHDSEVYIISIDKEWFMSIMLDGEKSISGLFVFSVCMIENINFYCVLSDKLLSFNAKEGVLKAVHWKSFYGEIHVRAPYCGGLVKEDRDLAAALQREILEGDMRGVLVQHLHRASELLNSSDVNASKKGRGRAPNNSNTVPMNRALRELQSNLVQDVLDLSSEVDSSSTATTTKKRSRRSIDRDNTAYDQVAAGPQRAHRPQSASLNHQLLTDTAAAVDAAVEHEAQRKANKASVELKKHVKDLEKALDKATKKERQLAEQLEIAQTSATLTNAANKEAVTKVKEEAQAKIKELTEKIKELTKEKKDVSKENERLQLELSAANIAAQAAAAAKPPPNIAPAAGGKLFHVNVVVVVSFDVMFQSFCRYFSTWWYFQPICWRTAAFTAYGTAQSIPTVTSTNPPAVSWCSAAAAPHSGS